MTVALLVALAWAVVLVGIACIPYRWRRARRVRQKVDRILTSQPLVRGWEDRRVDDEKRTPVDRKEAA